MIVRFVGRFAWALAVILLIAGTAAAQPGELVEDETVQLLDEVVIEPAEPAEVPRVQPAAVPRADDGMPPSVIPPGVFRPPR